MKYHYGKLCKLFILFSTKKLEDLLGTLKILKKKSISCQLAAVFLEDYRGALTAYSLLIAGFCQFAKYIYIYT